MNHTHFNTIFHGKRTKIILLIMTLLFCISLTACGTSYGENGIFNGLTQLPSPNLREVLDNYVYWEEVPNANSYIIKINGNDENVGNNLKYSIGAIMDERVEYNVPTLLHIYVKAVGNHTYFSDSEWSEELSYTYTKIVNTDSGKSESNTDNYNHQSNTSEQKNDSGSQGVNNSGAYANTGIGSSVNVIAAKNYSDYIKGVSVLNKSILNNDGLFVKNENIKATQVKNSSAQSIEDFVSGNTVTVDTQVGSNTKAKTMFCNIDVGLHSSATFNYSSYVNKYYYSLDSYIERYSLYINNYSVKSQYPEMFSTEYKNALKSLYNNQTESNYTDFFKTYGTHLIVSGIYGGRLNAYYSTVTNKAEIDSSVGSQLKIAVEGGISAVNKSSVQADVSTSIKNILKTSEFETAFYASAYGGDAFTATTIDGMNSHYANWTNSFNGSDGNAVLINYSSDGLIALWEILPSEYSSMAAGMEDAFLEYYRSAYSTFIDSFKAEKGNDYYLNANLLCCKLDNGYNYTEQDSQANNNHYSYNYEFGKFVVKNVKNQSGDSFDLVKTGDASIYFKVTNDCNNLPLQDNMTSRSVSNDNYSIGFYDMPGGDIGNRKVERGLLVANITYDDGSVATRTISTDIFNGAKAGDEILIANGIKKPC